MAIRACALACSQSPRCAGNYSGDKVHEAEFPHPGRPVRRADRQLGVHHRVIPGSKPMLGAGQVAQALAGAAQRDTGPQPGRGGGKIGDRPGHVLGQSLASPRITSVSVSSTSTSAGAAGGMPSRVRPSGPHPGGEKGDRRRRRAPREAPRPGRRHRRRPLAPFDGLPIRPVSRHNPAIRRPQRPPTAPGPDRAPATPRAAGPHPRGERASVEIQRAQHPAAPCIRPGGSHPGGQDLGLRRPHHG